MQKTFSLPSIKHRIPGLLITTLALVAGCASSGSDARSDAAVPGLAIAASTRDVNASFEALDAKLSATEPIGVVARIDHAANAPADLPLRPTRLVLFGNPKLGTPLMRINQVAGIDLPQKMLIYQDAGERTQVAYNQVDYLAQRHGVGNAPTLPAIAGALKNFASEATGANASMMGSMGQVGRGEGLVSVASNADAATTFDRLRTAVAANPALKIVAELDHAANAEKAGFNLRPTRLLVFGNPALGTPLMRSAQTIAIDLPQKMLIYTDASGRTFMVYNDPAFIARRHGVKGVEEEISKTAGALAKLASAAAGS